MTYDQLKTKNKVAVISRYKEPPSSIEKDLERRGYKVIIFNKHKGENLLPNVGREGQTYIHYILKNYHDLPDEVLFSQYAIDPHCDKKQKGLLFDSYLYDFIGVKPRCLEATVTRFKGVKDWPKLMHKLYGNFDYSLKERFVATGTTRNGIFRVSKEAILRNSFSFYEKCDELLSSSVSPKDGYLFERLWKFMFTDYGFINNYKFNYFKDRIFLFGSDSKGGRYQAGSYGHIKLSKDGSICYNQGINFYAHENEAHWTIKDDHLLIFNQVGGVTNIFNIADDKDWSNTSISGINFLGAKHHLKPIMSWDLEI